MKILKYCIYATLNNLWYTAWIWWLWNWLGVSILGLPHVDYWQSFGLRCLGIALVVRSVPEYMEKETLDN